MSGKAYATYCSGTAIALARHEEAAEQKLREDDRGHELHRLELGARERAREQAERHAEQGVADREQADEPRTVGGVETEQREPDGADDHRLQRGEHAEGERIAAEQREPS